jgi:DNA polymerase-3 subunit epsilon
MKVAFTGDSALSREALTRKATDAGLDVVNSVSSRTSLVVCNDRLWATGKLRKAVERDIAIVGEPEFLTLLESIAAGAPKESAAAPAPSALPAPAARPVAVVVDGPLRGRRVLVLGGPHDLAAAVRERIVAAGGVAAVNLTAQVSDVVLLEDGLRDRRWPRVETRQLRILDHESLTPAGTGTVVAGAAVSEAAAPEVLGVVLPRGGVVDLPDGQEWQLAIRWPELAEPIDVDVVAFVADPQEQVAGDEDFVFYNAPAHPAGCVDLALDVPGECLVSVNVDRLPAHATRVLVAAAVPDESTFGAVGPIEVVLRNALGSVVARSTLDAATTEATMVIADIYEREGRWRFRAVGQGYDFGLAALAVTHGVDIED